MAIQPSNKPFKLSFVMIIYLLGSIGLISLIIIVWSTQIAEDIIWNMFFLKGGIFIGDTTVPLDLVFWAMNYFFGPIFMITGTLTIPAVYGMYHLKTWAWKYTLLISMFWALFLFGLIVVWIFLQDDIKQLF